jgi:hypothetical protein
MTAESSKTPKEIKAKRQESSAIDQVVRSFVACGRCSFFLSGYRVIHDDFSQAVGNIENGWLELTWNNDTNNLIHKSYGGRIGQDTYHYEAVCSECLRAFQFVSSDEETGSQHFKIEIKPD